MVRAALAMLACLFVVATSAAPHHHDARLGDHACPACVSSGADVARDQTPQVEAVTGWPETFPAVPEQAPASGAPLGAVPGQSPPHA